MMRMLSILFYIRKRIDDWHQDSDLSSTTSTTVHQGKARHLDAPGTARSTTRAEEC